MSWPSQFHPLHRDVLKEIGNIGAGHATASLSQLLGQTVHMNVPEVHLVTINELVQLTGGEEQVVVATFMALQGDMDGYMFFVLQEETAGHLVNVLFNQRMSKPYREIHLSALQEVGNILCGAYLSALADFTGLNLHPSVPEVAIDMAAAILSSGLLEAGQVGDHALVIETCFYDRNRKEIPIDGHFFLLPDPDSFENLFHALGVRQNGKRLD